MFKPLIAATIGLSAMASVASADTIIVQSGPHTSVQSIIAYEGPSFGRMVEMCARFGFNCDVPGAEHVAAPLPQFSPEAQADADKRLAVQLLDWEEYAAQIRPHASPRDLFGWSNAPDVHDILGWMAPRTQPFRGLNAETFTHRLPSLTRPRGFLGLGTVPPHVIVPNDAFPQVTLPRPTYPRTFGDSTHPRALPHGGLIPWPTL